MTPFVTTLVCGCLLLNSGYFFYVVTKSFVHAFLVNIKHKDDKHVFRNWLWIANFLLFFESRQTSREPVISYSQTKGTLQLKLHRKRRSFLGFKSMALKSLERYYFTNIVTELYRIVVCRLKLDVMPKLFIEFLLRLSISFTKFEGKMTKKELFKDLADGDLSRLVAWATETESRKLQKIVRLDSADGGHSIPNMLLDDESLTGAIGLSREELQYIMDCLFDDKVLMGKTNLSDFYHSLTRIWIMDTDMLTFLFSVFKHVKMHNDKECVDAIEKSNQKLRRIQSKLEEAINGESSIDQAKQRANVSEMESRLQGLIAEQEQLRTRLKEMQANPDSYMLPDEGEKVESGLEAMMQDLGFTVKGALEKYVADYEPSSDEDSDSDSDSDASSD
ncbi:GCC2 and GCC3 domain containing protein [Babesia divergens]|uniref:GCC2 and GCC3 domain containing protein n=1 Tax=Babesia divergens TaxID=32595 RepID=A0AAD9GIR6_BABDI|nr:GCC2 and GCC3 domain containing protein [Babesia divergens]